MDKKKSSDKTTNSSVSPSSPGVKLTSEIDEGPYYKAGSPEKSRIWEAGVPGDKLTLTGTVKDTNARPIAHAWLDFWQANGQGEYDNSGYILRGHQYTDKSGKYVLETVLPGAYAVRTPHIHVKVQANTKSRIMTTQLFIPGLATNKADFLYRDDCQIEMKENAAGKKAVFNFVLKD